MRSCLVCGWRVRVYPGSRAASSGGVKNQKMKAQNTNDKQTKKKEAAREDVRLPIIPLVPVSFPGSSTLQRSGSFSSVRSLNSVRSSSSLKSDKPGLACFKKGGEKSSIRGSSPSITSIRSDSVLAAENARRASRETALGEKRKMDGSMDKDEEVLSDADTEDIEMEIEDTEGFLSLSESEEEEGSDVVMKEPGSRNRKRKRSGQIRGSAPTKRGKGRPTTTRQYRKLTEAKKAYNAQLKEEIALQKAKALRELSYGDLLSNLGIDLDNTVDDLKQDPTADISNRVRKMLAEVLIIARTSGNLKGTCQKELKHAAVMASAAVEVLRTRADNPTDDDTPRQIKALKDELECAKAMAKEVQRKVEKLHKKLEEERARDKRKKINYVVDSGSASTSPERSTKSRKEKEKERSKRKEHKEAVIETGSTMDIDPPPEAIPSKDPSKDSKKITAESVMADQKNWPLAIRPKIQGQARILEDRILVDHQVKLVGAGSKEVGKNPLHIREKPGPSGDNSEKKMASAAGLFEQLVPMLDKWIESRLGPLLPPAKTGQGKKKDGVTPLTKTAGKNPPTARKNEGASVEMIPNTGDVKGGEHTTWTQVLGRKQKATVKKQHQEKKENQIASTVSSKKPNARKDAGSSNANSSKKMPGKSKPSRRRPPRTAAVTLSCPSGKYAEALSKAKEEINLEELGIKGLRPRKGITGALVLEISGADGTNKAKQLKEKMQNALRDMEGVRVARPVKCVDLRIKDVLESTPEVEIREAIAAHGEDAKDDIRVGAPQRSLNSCTRCGHDAP